MYVRQLRSVLGTVIYVRQVITGDSDVRLEQ